MKRNTKIYIFLLVVMLPFLGTDAYVGSILHTKHNLSVSGPGPIKAATEDRVCIFCHATGRKGMGVKFLWNRRADTTHYIPYQSSTLYARVGQPTGASKLCLSCHDGTIALGALISEPREIPFRGGIRFLPPGPSRLGTDLSDDHPVSFVYDTSLALAKRELRPPSMLPREVPLDKGGELQCTACHDPHDDIYGKFLVTSNQYSNLCVSCHDKDGWAVSSHAVSHAQWNGLGADPWANSDYQTVAENGCEDCHSPHTAGGGERLLKFVFEEDNCFVCHNGNVAYKNIERELTKPYRHSVQDHTGAHDAAEDFVSGGVPKHVECEDCHNPHQANDDASPGPPVVSGANKGVKAIGVGGQLVSTAQNLYEICFKCHADINMVTTLPITRQIDQLNTRLEFNLANPSFHPVVSQGINPDVPSLLSPLTTQSIISCIDCHNTDDPNAPRGPHGSIYEYLLERDYNTEDFTQENPRNYAMCYKCHNRDSILRDQSFSKHRQHIVDQRAPCSACHDPHGISDIQGNPVNNSHLINFDLTIVRANGQGRLEFDDLGRFTGQCFLNCHGEEHGPKRYP